MKEVYWYCAALVLIGLAFIFGCEPKSQPVPANRAGAVVKVTVGLIHGSGVHIGNGFILTNAHVVGEATSVKLKSDVGDIQDAAVLWAAKEHDVALVMASRPARFDSANLTCGDVIVRQPLETAGNPSDLEFVYFSARVAGPVEKRGPFAAVFPVEMVALPGQSGSPLFDMTGNVVGIVTATKLLQINPDIPSPSFTGIGYAVPSSAICKLLGRA